MHETQRVSHLAMFLLLRLKESGCVECMQMHQPKQMPSQGRTGRSAGFPFSNEKPGRLYAEHLRKAVPKVATTSKKTVKKVKLQDATFFKGGSG